MNDALKAIIERHIGNVENWAVNLKGLIILHRALQNIHINKSIVKKLRKNAKFIQPYENKNQADKFNIRMYIDVSTKYSKYIKYYMEVCTASDLLTNPAKTFADQIFQVPTEELLKNYEYFKRFAQMIFSIFSNANFCK